MNEVTIEIDLAKIERGTHIGQVKVTRGGKTFYRKQRIGRKEPEKKPADVEKFIDLVSKKSGDVIRATEIMEVELEKRGMSPDEVSSQIKILEDKAGFEKVDLPIPEGATPVERDVIEAFEISLGGGVHTPDLEIKVDPGSMDHIVTGTYKFRDMKGSWQDQPYQVLSGEGDGAYITSMSKDGKELTTAEVTRNFNELVGKTDINIEIAKRVGEIFVRAGRIKEIREALESMGYDF